jgi:hypothetical protein
VDRALRDWKGKSLQATICRLTLGSVVYFWMFRNDFKFGNFKLSEEKLVQKVCREVRNRNVKGYFQLVVTIVLCSKLGYLSQYFVLTIM